MKIDQSQSPVGRLFAAVLFGVLAFGPAEVVQAEPDDSGEEGSGEPSDEEGSDDSPPAADGPGSEAPSEEEGSERAPPAAAAPGPEGEVTPAEARRRARMARQVARREGRSYRPEWASHGFSLNGLYPLWESTGYVLDQGKGFLGTSHVQFGLGRRFQLGVRPIPFFYAAPNMHVRVGLLQRDQVKLSVQVETLVLLSGSARSFISSSYQSRIDSWAHEFLVLPVSLAATFEPTPWLNIHPTVSFMGTFDLREVAARGTLGAFVISEFLVARRHGLRIHVGEVGFWDHDIFVFGVSYRLNYRSLDLQIGYAYRRSVDGGQGAPMVSLGFRL